LKVPSFGFGGGTDSKISDAQLGLESAMSLLTAGLAGTNMIYGAGQMETGKIGSPYLVVMGSEIMGMTRRIMRGVEMDEDRLCRRYRRCTARWPLSWFPPYQILFQR